MLLDDNTKRCTKCGEIHQATREYFSVDKKSHDGLDSWCKPCKREAVRQWQKANPEKKRANARRYYTTHLDKKREADRRYRSANLEKVRERARQWRKDNPEKLRTKDQRRRARQRYLPATLTPQEWEDIKAVYGYACAYCGKAWYEIKGVLEQDHVIPVTQGGPYTIDNIVPACSSCNKYKGGRTPEQAGMPIIRKQLITQHSY